MIADVGYTVFYFFTIQLQDDTERTVRRWVVRPQVQEHDVFVFVTAGQTPVFRYKTQVFLFKILLGLVLHIRGIFSGTCRIFLAQRVTFPIGWQQDTTEHWMPFEVNAEHIVSFTLVPVGIWPDIGRSRNIQIVLI